MRAAVSLAMGLCIDGWLEPHHGGTQSGKLGRGTIPTLIESLLFNETEFLVRFSKCDIGSFSPQRHCSFFLMSSQSEDDGRSHHGAGKHPSLLIPSAVQAEHKEFHQKLRELTHLGGRTGKAAVTVEKLLEPYFMKEEQLALPPLGLLAELSVGGMPRDRDVIIRMTDQLKQEMPQLLAEHKKVVAALQDLQDATDTEGNPQGVQFAKALAAHAALEEQVLYPSALLVRQYLNEKKK